MSGGIPTLKTGAYASSKFAVRAFTEVLYHENRDSGVRFASVCPLAVATPLLQRGREADCPKMLDLQPPMEPAEVLDEIERCLGRGRFMVYPGQGTRVGALVRRVAPGLVWKQVHQTEGWLDARIGAD